MRLNHQLLPMIDYHKAKELMWDPRQVDCVPDRRDWAAMSAEERDLILRVGALFHAGEEAVAHDLAPLLVAVRRAGAIHAFDTLNHFFLITEMIVPGSSYWNIAIGREKGEVEKDAEGIQTMKTLGQNMAWVLKKIQT